MVITQIKVTDENGVEHVVEGKGWFRVRSQHYRTGKDMKPANPELHVEAHITLATKEERDQISDVLQST